MPSNQPQVVNIYSPYPLRGHHHDTASIDKQALSWCRHYGLWDPNNPAAPLGCASAVAAALPEAHESTLVALTTYFYWASLLDDHWDTHRDLASMVAAVGELQRAIYAAPQAPRPIGDRWAHSLHALRSRIENVLTDDDIAQFRLEHTVWLGGQLWYTALQQQPTPPPIGTYLRMRWAKSGIATLLPFTADTLGIHRLTEQQRSEPAVRAFTEAVMFACALLNDIFSAAKEANSHTLATNAISVLAHAEKRDTATGMVTTCQLYERILVLTLRLQQQLRADPRPAIAGYGAALPNWIPAGIAWAGTTTRYRTPDTATTWPHLNICDTPTLWNPDDTTAPPYPDIAWWWTTLT